MYHLPVSYLTKGLILLLENYPDYDKGCNGHYGYDVNGYYYTCHIFHIFHLTRVH